MTKNFVSINSLTQEEKLKLKKVVKELSDSLQRMDSERLFQKEAIDDVSEELGIDKKLLRKMARTYFKANYNEEVEQHKTFEEFYDMVMNTKESSGNILVAEADLD